MFNLRWPLEVCCRNVKQLLGFEDRQSRISKATQRTAPLISYIYAGLREVQAKGPSDFRVLREGESFAFQKCLAA